MASYNNPLVRICIQPRIYISNCEAPCVEHIMTFSAFSSYMLLSQPSLFSYPYYLFPWMLSGWMHIWKPSTNQCMHTDKVRLVYLCSASIARPVYTYSWLVQFHLLHKYMHVPCTLILKTFRLYPSMINSLPSDSSRVSTREHPNGIPPTCCHF